MGEQVVVARREDETAAELKRMLADAGLSMPGGLSARSRSRVVRPQKMEDIRAAQSRCVICLALLVDEQRKGDARVLAKHLGVPSIPESDGSDNRAPRFEFFLVLAQLRDVLAAEDSPVVPKESQHRGLFLPQRAEAHGSAIAIRQDDIVQCFAKGARHPQKPV
jgi:hypothetical protein